MHIHLELYALHCIVHVNTRLFFYEFYLLDWYILFIMIILYTGLSAKRAEDNRTDEAYNPEGMTCRN